MAASSPPHKYLAIDFLRGISAFAILIYHYQAFYFTKPGGPPIFSSTNVQPLHFLFAPLFDHGAMAVQLFWMISGFVFAASYVERRTTTAEFVVARFARLYPLHFLTLVIVAVIQWLSHRLVGQYQIFPFNDPYHFVLNLFMAEYWGLQKGHSFNAVIWSVSIEVAIYALFWLSVPALRRFGAVSSLALVVAFYLLIHHQSANLFWICGFYFYLGAFAFFAVGRLGSASSLGVGAVLFVAWAAYGTKLTAYYELLNTPCLFAAVLFCAAAIDRSGVAAAPLAKAAWIGESTYGTYLIHMPVVMTATLLFTVFGVDRIALLAHAWFLLGFVVLVFALARVSYGRFELPAQKFLKRRLLAGRAEIAPPAAAAQAQP